MSVAVKEKQQWRYIIYHTEKYLVPEDRAQARPAPNGVRLRPAAV
jgi:hypothetical protein